MIPRRFPAHAMKSEHQEWQKKKSQNGFLVLNVIAKRMPAPVLSRHDANAMLYYSMPYMILG